jgi:hypothetical protein
MPEGAIYRAEVTHTRAGKVRHRFRHSVFYLYLDRAAVRGLGRGSAEGRRSLRSPGADLPADPAASPRLCL